MFLLTKQPTNSILLSFINTKDLNTQGENCNMLKLFLWGPWEGIVSAAPVQANYFV